MRLVPVTAYSRERFSQLYGDRKYVPHAAYPRQDAVDPALWRGHDLFGRAFAYRDDPAPTA